MQYVWHGTGANLTAAATYPANSGVYSGFVVGEMYNDSRVNNCIVKTSKMTTMALLYTTNNPQIYLGGIAGGVGSPTISDTGNGHRYIIDNCYVSASVGGASDFQIYSDPGYTTNFSTGGIVGRINKQPVWPTNCLYTGTLSTYYPTSNYPQFGGFIGPIFGSLVGDVAPVFPNSTTNTAIDDKIFSGTDVIGGVPTNLTITSYYTNYLARATNFTSTCVSGDTPVTTDYRVAINATGYLGRFQGVNKGIYDDDPIVMFIRLSSTADANNTYVSWDYNNGDYTFVHRHQTALTTNTANDIQISTQISDNYYSSNYTYTWYANGQLQPDTGSSISAALIRNQADEYVVVTFDGSYYNVASVTLKKTNADIVFKRSGLALTAMLAGDSIRN